MLHIHLADALMNSRKQHLPVFLRLYTVNIVGSGFHHLRQRSKTGSILQIYFHTDQISPVIFVFFQLYSLLSGDVETLSFIFFNIIDIVDSLKF